MKDLLIAEMKRAIKLLEEREHPLEMVNDYTDCRFEYHSPAELKSILKAIRKHSVIYEKEEKTRIESEWKKKYETYS